MDADDRISILAVDDQPENLLALDAILTDSQVRLVKAHSGREALKLLLDGDFAVILMDAYMPDMDGFETATAIRARKKTRSIPIIFVTAMHKDSFHAATGYDIGAVDYIFKPLVPEILRAKVSVFVELYRKAKEIEHHAQEVARYQTELERRLNELNHLNQRLQLLSEEASCARDSAVKASRFKSEFLANMSHEIRTPMNGILGMIEILLRSGLSDKQVEFANTIREAGNALLSVINDILDFSKIEAGKLTVELSEFEPIRLVEGIAELLSAHIKRNNVSLVTFIAPEIPLVLRGDPARIRQVLTNFVSNALKFTEQGTVLVKASVESRNDRWVTIRFSVTDPGIGLTDEELSRLFEPFVQVHDGSSSHYGGTGLGLSICKRLVELMRGTIEVTSAKGHGSTFSFCLPLEESTSIPFKHSATAELTGSKILIIDDDPIAREIVLSYMHAWGLQGDATGDAHDAMSILRTASESHPYDLVIIDLLMPNMNGIELAKAIRNDSLISNTKLILMSAFDKPGRGEEAISFGFSGYLTKPLRQSDLLNAITSALWGLSSKTTHQIAKGCVLSGAGQALPRSELILVAEDHPINQEVALILLRHLGFEAHIANNGHEAVDKTSRTPYSLIFMDCQMPRMDGFEATRELRKLEIQTGKRVPIIAMTAHAIDGSKEQCLEVGMDDYISKPIDPTTLQSVINQWLPTTSAELAEGLHRTADGIQSAKCPIDLNGLVDRVGQDGAKRLLRMFIEQAPTMLNDVTAAVSNADTKRARAAAHALKGIYGTLYADGLRTDVAALESKIGEHDWRIVQADLEKILASAVELTQSVELILKSERLNSTD